MEQADISTIWELPGDDAQSPTFDAHKLSRQYEEYLLMALEAPEYTEMWRKLDLSLRDKPAIIVLHDKRHLDMGITLHRLDATSIAYAKVAPKKGSEINAVVLCVRFTGGVLDTGSFVASFGNHSFQQMQWWFSIFKWLDFFGQKRQSGSDQATPMGEHIRIMRDRMERLRAGIEEASFLMEQSQLDGQIQDELLNLFERKVVNKDAEVIGSFNNFKGWASERERLANDNVDADDLGQGNVT